MPQDVLRILVVADDVLARAGLASLLEKPVGIAVVGQCGPEADFGALQSAAPADVIAWDVGWEAGVSLDRLEEAAESLPPVVVLIHDPDIAADAWSAGARGVLDRDVALPALVAALRAAGEGLSVAGDGLRVGSPSTSRSGAGLLLERLTPREHDVLQLVAQGLPNKTIAGRLGVTEATVKFHVNSLMRKLGAQSRTDAVVRASRLGLVLL
jgi:two-component system nitrate/nitrite response regulator NarL